jgi:cytochrome c oxidase assembly protein subunit 11
MNKGKVLTLFAALCLLGGMTTLTAYSVPLYELFCRTTGYGGTTQVSDGTTGKVLNRVMTVRFNADISPDMPWVFEPKQNSVKIYVGEPALAFFTAKSNSDEEVVGTATFNVVPAKAGRYFNKIDCFCFTEQKLGPGEAADLPVQFFVDPAIADDRNLDDVETITLSYTFFRQEQEPKPAPRTVLSN